MWFSWSKTVERQSVEMLGSHSRHLKDKRLQQTPKTPIRTAQMIKSLAKQESFYDLISSATWEEAFSLASGTERPKSCLNSISHFQRESRFILFIMHFPLFFKASFTLAVRCYTLVCACLQPHNMNLLQLQTVNFVQEMVSFISSLPRIEALVNCLETFNIRLNPILLESFL